MIEHVRETLVETGAKVAHVADEDVRRNLQLASMMLVRLAGFVSQAPSELVSAAAGRAGTPMPCKTSAGCDGAQGAPRDRIRAYE